MLFVKIIAIIFTALVVVGCTGVFIVTVGMLIRVLFGNVRSLLGMPTDSDTDADIIIKIEKVTSDDKDFTKESTL